MLRALIVLLALAGAACGASVGGDPENPPATGGSGGAGAGGSGPVMVGAACKPGATKLPAPRLWRLTAAQFNDTVADLLGDTGRPIRGELLQGAGQGGYLNNALDLRVRDSEAVQLRLVAKALAADTVASRLTRVWDTTRCPEAMMGNQACAQTFVADFGKRAFRRPLDAAELERYLMLYTAASARGARLGVQAVIEAMLQSPKFLYRFELGTGAAGKVRLTAHELASALSYTLTGTMPDAALMALADRNELATPEQLEREARRLLALPGARRAFAEFYRQFLEYQELQTRDKDPERFPQYEALRAPMAEELSRFVDDLLFGTDSRAAVQDLLGASHTFVNAPLAKLYGVPEPASGWARVALPGHQRAGVLAMSGLMAHTAVLERTSPVNRGRFVQERFFCTHVPDPPGNVDTAVPSLTPGLTRRQQLDGKTSAPECAACHGLMNGIGFGLENLDAIGRFRDKEDNGLPIDARAEIKGTRDSDGPFEGPRGLAERLMASAQVKECLAVQTFRYLAGRAETAGDACSVAAVHERFIRTGNLKELAVGYVLSEAFAYRQH